MEECSQAPSELISPTNLPMQSCMHAEPSKPKSKVTWKLQSPTPENTDPINTESLSEMILADITNHKISRKETANNEEINHREIAILEHSYKSNLKYIQRQYEEIIDINKMLELLLSIKDLKKEITKKIIEVRRTRIGCRRTVGVTGTLVTEGGREKSSRSRSRCSDAASGSLSKTRTYLVRNAGGNLSNRKKPQQIHPIPRPISPRNEYFTGSSFHTQSPSIPQLFSLNKLSEPPIMKTLSKLHKNISKQIEQIAERDKERERLIKEEIELLYIQSQYLDQKISQIKSKE